MTLLGVQSDYDGGRRVTSAVRGANSHYDALRPAACDVCAAPRSRRERRRLVWNSGVDGDLVLAELCARCASESEQLLAIYGGRGRDAIRLTQDGSVSAVEPAVVRRVVGMLVRGLVYVLIAVAAFVVVTLVTARS
jgi:hypothetical protein